MHMMGAKECGIGRRIRKFRKNVQNPFGGGSPLFFFLKGMAEMHVSVSFPVSYQPKIIALFGWVADLGKSLTIIQ